jgi:hypothetical protein
MVAMGDNEVERLKALTLDLLGANQQAMSYANIYWEHYECDGEVDEVALRDALDGLIGEGKIVYGDADEYRWMPPQEGESLADKVKQLEAEVERLRSRDAKLIADLKAVDAWTGDGDVETLDPLARRLWHRIDADGIEVNGASYVARSLLQDVERLEDHVAVIEKERDHDGALALRLRRELKADRAAVRGLVEALPKCERLGCDKPATRGERGYVCDTHSCGDAVELTWGNPLRALQFLMATWPSRADEAEAHREQCCAVDASCGFDHGASACHAGTDSRFVLRSPDDVLEIALKHSARIKSEAQPRYVGEFGDIDEPSVGDVDGYGRRA